MGQAVKRHIAFLFLVRRRLQLGHDAQVFIEPRRSHRTRGQARDAHELHNIFGLGIGQHALKTIGRIAFARDRKRGAQLHCGCAQALQAQDVFAGGNPTGGNERNFSLQACAFEILQHLRNRHIKIKALILQIRHLCRAQMAARQARVFNHYRIRQSTTLFPFAHHQLHAARIRQNWDQGSARKVARHIGQVQWQAGAHHQRVGAAF